MLGYQPWRCMKHNLIADVVIKQRWFLKIAWENFVVKQFAFFFVQIVKGPKTNIFTCKLCAWVIFIILFTRLLCDNSNSLTYKPRKRAKSNTFMCQLCDCTSHADQSEADPVEGLRGLQPPLWEFFFCYFAWFFVK